jgi:ketosteroid isomerase-like protein
VLKVIVVPALIACLAAASVAHAAEPSPDQRIARAYLAAYSAIDPNAMMPLLASHAVFADQTATPAEGGPILLTGRDAFLKQFAAYGLQRIAYDLTSEFESNGRTVFAGHVNAYYPREGGRVLRWRSEIVTVVTVANGKVVRHEDFANYAGARKTLQDSGAKR